MRINKKGQIEDFVADLIPSLVIIVIGLYVLSTMHSVNEGINKNIKLKLEYKLEYPEITVADYLTEKVTVDNKKMSLSELISLSYKNEGYQQKLKEMLEIPKKIEPIEYIAETPKQEPGETIAMKQEECWLVKIIYPDNSILEIGKDCLGEGEIVMLPTYGGEYLQANITLGAVH